MWSNNLSTIGTCKQTKTLLLVFEKFIKNLAVPLVCCCHSFLHVTSCVTVKYFFDVSKQVVFERASSAITPFSW